jgi:hypothetical protein
MNEKAISWRVNKVGYYYIRLMNTFHFQSPFTYVAVFNAVSKQIKTEMV